MFEALPWIKNLTGKTVVIKYGGAAMVDEQLRRDVMSDIVLLKIIGMRPVIVHGGGKAINEALSHYDIPVEFKNGQRVTTPATMDIVREVLGGKVNQELVAALNHHGNLAVGVSGSDAGTLIAEPLDPELGRVGKVTHVNTDYIERLLDSEYIPVIATVAAGRTVASSTSTPICRRRGSGASCAQGDFFDRCRWSVQGSATRIRLSPT
ncbi:MAG: acetylglutamate kinase [Collinsella sp.]